MWRTYVLKESHRNAIISTVERRRWTNIAWISLPIETTMRYENKVMRPSYGTTGRATALFTKFRSPLLLHSKSETCITVEIALSVMKHRCLCSVESCCCRFDWRSTRSHFGNEANRPEELREFIVAQCHTGLMCYTVISFETRVTSKCSVQTPSRS